ncbi:MAG: M23 family metallopeptidase [Leptospiraceae bacterium]|nr:M23 family metallopeptidase [Leptospiraceae bacterium]
MSILKILIVILLILPYKKTSAEISNSEFDEDESEDVVVRLNIQPSAENQQKPSIDPPKNYKPEASKHINKKQLKEDFTSKFYKPTKNKMLIQRGYSNDSRNPHRGLSIRIPENGKVISSKDGKVLTIDKMEGYRNYIIVQHRDGMLTVYGNLEIVTVSEGQKLRKGEILGKVPREKNLYFQLNKGEKTVDPSKYISLK